MVDCNSGDLIFEELLPSIQFGLGELRRLVSFDLNAYLEIPVAG
jgi:hypothetical protein